MAHTHSTSKVGRIWLLAGSVIAPHWGILECTVIHKISLLVGPRWQMTQGRP